MEKWLDAKMGRDPQDPKAVESLVSDLKMMVAYETAADFKEKGAMESAFNAMTWDDPQVAAALPKYLAAPSGPGVDRVNYAFNALVPRQADPKDVKQTMMHTWLKARLFYYDAKYPFAFNPYSK